MVYSSLYFWELLYFYMILTSILCKWKKKTKTTSFKMLILFDVRFGSMCFFLSSFLQNVIPITIRRNYWGLPHNNVRIIYFHSILKYFWELYTCMHVILFLCYWWIDEPERYAWIRMKFVLCKLCKLFKIII
jgi:hypothetical protein